MKKTIPLLLFFFSAFSAVTAQTVNITSFQHNLRWMDEFSFPPYVTNEQVKNKVLDAAAVSLSNRFNAKVFGKPPVIDYRFISMFGKPAAKEPTASASTDDLQVSFLSMITRATTGAAVYWHMNVWVQRNRQTVYKREIKHQVKNYNTTAPWFSEEEFTDLFALLLDELLENRTPLSEPIVLGIKPENKDSILKANSEAWKVDKNKELFGFAKPDFGPYHTLGAGKTDSATMVKKTRSSAETSFEVTGGKLYAGQSRMVHTDKTRFCSLNLMHKTDTTTAYFSIITNESRQKQTALGFLLSRSSEGQNNTIYYDRSLEGIINTGDDSASWNFFITHYVNGEIGSGELQQGTQLLRFSYNGPVAAKKQIIITNEEGSYLAAMASGLSNTEIRIRNDLPPATKQAIATVFAILISIKHLPD